MAVEALEFLIESVPTRRDRVFDWKVWNVEKDIFAGASERIISEVGACRKFK